MGHILVVSVISMPAALAISAIMVPFNASDAKSDAAMALDDPPANAMDALMRGTSDGLAILLAIVATLLVSVALVALVNEILSLLGHWRGSVLSLQRIFAWPFRPLMWLIGIPWHEAETAASLMATKTVLNEFVAYRDLAALPADALSPASRLILTYALCGFANFGSLGIMVGGMAAMVPDRRTEIVGLGLRSVLAGTLATCFCGAVAGALLA
jgi:CNT family concentrative nucleoside transporter